MQVFALILLVCTPGALHRELLPDFVLAVPALAAGTLIGVWLFGKIDDRKFRYAVLSLLLISGLMLIH
jgi:uncharacterized membrane protein YfcA